MIAKLANFRGDLSDISAEKVSLMLTTLLQAALLRLDARKLLRSNRPTASSWFESVVTSLGSDLSVLFEWKCQDEAALSRNETTAADLVLRSSSHGEGSAAGDDEDGDDEDDDSVLAWMDTLARSADFPLETTPIINAGLSRIGL